MSTSQAAIIVKQPANANLYYIFTQNADGGSAAPTVGALWYSVVDMSLAAGMGSVTVKNILLDPISSERLAATKHCNGKDFWLISHEGASNKIMARLITAQGLNPVPVVSAIGATISLLSTVGCFKFSPDGKKLAMALRAHSSAACQIFDFNNATGIVSNPLTIDYLQSPLDIYSCEFSPDGTKLYTQLDFTSNTITQWDLCQGTLFQPFEPIYTISVDAVSQMLLAPNGKIYMSHWNEQYLGVINNPNASGAACNYVDVGQIITPGKCSVGLPVFPNYWQESIKIPAFTHTVNPQAGCLTASFALPGLSNTLTVCGFTTYSIGGQDWNFGEPSSGSANLSSDPNPYHT